MKVCPKCGHKEFLVTWHVTQTELADFDGGFHRSSDRVR